MDGICGLLPLLKLNPKKENLMLKLSIPATLLNTIASSIATIALNVRETSSNHKGLKAQEEKTILKTAEILGIPVEQYRADKIKQAAIDAEKFAAKLPFFSLIKEKATKVATLTKTDDAVVIGINEEYLTDCVKAAERVTLKLLGPIADVACIFGDEEENSEAFEAKWFHKEDKTLEVEIDKATGDVTVNKVDANDVPLEVRTSVTYFGWSIEASDFAPEPFFLDESYEDHILVHFLTATKESSSIQIPQGRVKRVLASTATLLETAKEQELPVSLVKAIRAFYGQAPLVDEAPVAE